MKFKPHSQKQEEFFNSTKPISIAATGIQWGKSISGVWRLINSMFTYTARDDNFIVTSPTYKILYQSTLPVFMMPMRDYGHYDKKNECFHFHNGGTVWFRTGQNPDSVVGITNVRHILCDEAGLYTLYFWQNIQARSSIRECPIDIVTSPYSLNWLYTDYIRKVHAKDPMICDLVHLCQAKSCENPYFPEKEYERKRQLMDARRFNMIYGGSFDRAEGLVYDCFDSSIHEIDPIPLPPGTRFFGGIDWGYTDPCVIRIRAVTEDGMHYGVDEYVKTQMRQDDILEQTARLKAIWNVEKYYADPSRPDIISYLNQHGITTVTADNDIVKGIERHYDLIKSGNYYIFKNSSRHTRDEYETYHYPEPSNLKPDQNQKKTINIPVDQHNHAMDCERYITSGTYMIGRLAKKAVDWTDVAGIKVKETSVKFDLNRDKLIKKPRTNYNANLHL